MDNTRKKRIILGITGIIGAVLLMTFFGIGYYLNSQLDKVNQIVLPESAAELNINEKAINLNDEIINIAMFGVDSWESMEGRSDAIIIVSIDKKNDKLKISSVMRDTFVDLESYGMTKINHAYAYGGPILAIKTLNRNFSLNIKDYFAVNFEGLERLVNLIGGVDVSIKSYELPAMTVVGISSSGEYRLNGRQALEYSRIRYQGNSDFERTDRQRLILSLVFEKINNAGILEFTEIVEEILPYTETSMSKEDILAFGKSVFDANLETIDQARFPVEGSFKPELINGVYYLVIDLPATTDQIHQFIYDDIKPLNVV